MATFGSTVRRGLPRRPGGGPWPPAGVAPVTAAPTVNGDGAVPEVIPGVARVARHAGTDAGTGRVATREPVPGVRRVRRGLPRVPGGEPWPPASVIPASAPPADLPVSQPAESDAAIPRVATRDAGVAAAAPTLRRGLPRVAGGEPWPPAGFAPATTVPATTAPATTVPAGTVTDAAALSLAEALPGAAAQAAASVGAEVAAPATATGFPLSQPLPLRRTVWAGATADRRPVARPEPARVGPFTRAQWAGAVIVGGAGLLYAAGMAVLAVRWLLSTAWGTDFLAAYPGEYHLPEGAPVGFPAWLGWQHFFNVFLMVLIIRTGLQVRTEKRPTVFWTPRRDKKGKISLNLWFHQSLDILWLVNGVIFVVLLFVTGQWLRIVPTSWEVFPNAVSAGLQYVSLDWPTENGWVNYNSLQQLAYFTTVFLAAPLAALTGVRMSGIWPKTATGLNKAYPVQWARAVHFPVMLYFVVFITVHVFLVFATGALRNLNHMYAAQGATDPNTYAANWTGFWFLTASLIVIAAAWIAARPLVLAPLARLFGTVSSR